MPRATPQTGAGNVTTTVASGNVTSIAVAKPSNTAVGDLLVASVLLQQGQTGGNPVLPTVPSGWTRVGPTSAGSSPRPSGLYVCPVADSTALAALASSWTWGRTDGLSGRALGRVRRVTNVDLTSYLDVAGTYPSTDQSGATLVIPGATVTGSNSTLYAFAYSNNSAGTGNVPAPTAPSGMTDGGYISQGSSGAANSTLWDGWEDVSAGATGTRSVAFSPNITNGQGYAIALKGVSGGDLTAGPADAVGISDAVTATLANSPTVTPADVVGISDAVTAVRTGLLAHARQAMPTSTTVRARVETVGAITDVRLAVSTSSAMTSPVLSPAAAPDGDGFTTCIVTGLAPDTAYYHQVQLNGTLAGEVGQTRTLPTVGAVASFGFAAGCCSYTGSNSSVFDTIRNRTGLDGLRARFLAHLGDIHYSYAGGGTAPDDNAELTGVYQQALRGVRQSQLYRDVPLSHTWSDNDFCGSNSDGTYAAKSTMQSVHRKLFAEDLAATDGQGIYKTWTVGRVTFVQTDSRSYMSARGAVDNSAKSMLGATQKQWLKDTVLAAVQAGRVVVWLHDNSWTGSSLTNGSNENWRAFTTERNEIGTYFASNNCSGRMIYVHGDDHVSGADSGANNAFGGFPLIAVGVLNQTSSASAETWDTMSRYPTTDAVTTSQFGWFDVEDTAETLTFRYKCIDSGGVERGALTKTFAMTLTGTGADPVGITDQATVGRGVAPADPVGIADAVVTTMAYAAVVADPIGVTDVAALDRAVPVADVVGVVDATAAAMGLARAAADTLSITDVASTTTGGGGNASDTTGVTDEVTTILDAARTPADPVGITDETTTALDALRGATDVVGVVDAATASLGLERAAADTTGITDDASAVLALVRAPADIVGITDEVTVVFQDEGSLVTRAEPGGFAWWAASRIGLGPSAGRARPPAPRP